MKLAEALIARKDYQNKAAQIKRRMEQNIKVEEDTEPAEDIAKLFRQYDATMSDLETLVKRINKTNAVTVIDAGETLVDAIAARDCLKAKIGVYNELIKEAADLRGDSWRSEKRIKYIRLVDISEMRKSTDGMAKQFRELDTKIQGLNWTTELI
ncbi:MAG: DIP1984 family protein [Defluviitaleaceae bacterium]|nr:DIP1984 family protein [Defluviitaleaceae bacterium]